MKMFTKLWFLMVVSVISSSVLVVQAQKSITSEKAPVKNEYQLELKNQQLDLSTGIAGEIQKAELSEYEKEAIAAADPGFEDYLANFSSSPMKGEKSQITVTLGTGTTYNSSTAHPCPYGTYYKNMRQQYLLRASELTALGLGAGNITAIAFNVYALNTVSAMPNYTIKMKSTALTALTTTFETGTYTTVWTAVSHTPVVGWNTYTFTTAFYWDGTSNLLVDICHDLIATYTTNASVYYTATTGTNTALFYRSDVTVACPYTTGSVSVNRANMQITGEQSAAPLITVTPNTLSFGYVPSGSSAELPYVLAGGYLSPASGNIVITAPANFEVSLTSGSGFSGSISVPYTGGTLPNTNIYVKFSPTSPNTAYSGTITNVGGSTFANVAVSGNTYLYSLYCTSSATSTADEEIFNVTVGTLNNTSDCSTTAPGPGSINMRYSNYTTSVTAPDLAQTLSTSFSVQIGTCGGNYGNGIKIFIDYNHDGDFTDADETVYASAAATSGPHTETGSFNVPVTATLGITMMRVVNVETATPATTIQPCGTYTWGETEDYLVNIVEATSPYLVAVPNSLNFGSVVNGGTSAEMTYDLSGDNLTAGPIVVTAPANFEVSLTSGSGFGSSVNVTYTPPTLAATTIYARFLPTAPNTVYSGIITNVGGGASVDVAVSGSSPCDPAIAPYSEDFTAWPPVCWDLTGGTYSWAQYTTGVSCAYANFWSQTSGNTDVMTTLPIDISGISNPAFEFYWSHHYNASYPTDSLFVYVSDNNGVNWTQVWMLGNVNFESNDGATNTTPGTFVPSGILDLSSFASPILIQFYGKSGYGPDCYIDNVSVFGAAYGTLNGYVYKYGTTTPITGATISFGTYSTNSGIDGSYTFPSVLVGTYTVDCSAAGYVSSSAPGVVITNGGTTTQDFYLQWAEIAVNPASVNENLQPDATLDKTITITNSAPAALNYTSSLQFLTDNGGKSKAAGDILLDLNIEAATADVGNLGTEFDGTYFYVSGSNGGVAPMKLYKLDQTGALVGTYDQPAQATTAWGMRDLAFNAGKIYGGSEDGFYEFDIASSTFTTLFTGNLGLGVIRALAYYPVSGNFLTVNWSGAITEFTSAGAIVTTYTAPAGLSGIYGLAWDSWNNKLWLFDQSGTPSTTFFEYDMTTMALTGVTYQVPMLSGLSSQIAGGAFFSLTAVTGKAVLGGLVQGTDAGALSQDHVFLMELNVTETWLTITANGSGTVPGTAKGTLDMTIHLDATGFTNGTVKTANIIINSNALNEPVLTIPVTMNVIAGHRVSGNVYYGNTGTTKPMQTNTTVTLTPGSTVSTGAAGYYEFNFIVDGNYTITGASTKPWGGLQALDAIQVQRFVSGALTFTNLQRRAGDVNKSSSVQNLDATFIRRRVSSIAVPQWTAPNWIFDGPFGTPPALQELPITVAGSDLTQELRTLCSGDVNGSYTPPAE